MIPISIENARAIASAFRSGADGMTSVKQPGLKLTLVAHTVRGMRSYDLVVEYVEERRKHTLEVHEPINIVVSHEGLLVQSPNLEFRIAGESPGGLRTPQDGPWVNGGPGPEHGPGPDRQKGPCGQRGEQPPDAPRRGPPDGHPPYKRPRYKRRWLRWLRRSRSR